MPNTKKTINYMTEGDDVWGGWEEAVDYVVNAGGGNDKLYGYNGDDELDGGDGDDEIYGGNGKDKIKGGNGNDKLYGGDGDDDIDGGDGDDEIFGGRGKDKLKGGKGKDKIFGGEGDDELDGGLGDDELFGEVGKDKLWGRYGKDKLFGGDGDDELFGGQDDDLLFGDAGDDQLYGEEHNDQLFGSSGNDLLDGGTGNDSLYGEDGNDSLFGGEGADLLYGGANADQLNGGVGNDELFGNGGIDTLEGGDGDDYLSGGDDNDSLIGGSGFDILQGGTGNDTLDGVGTTGVSADTIDILIGESGADSFILGNTTTAYYNDGDNSLSGLNDYGVLKDFNRLQDSLQLHGSASDYVVGEIPTGLAAVFANMDAAGIYLDTDNSGDLSANDEFIAAFEYVAPSGLSLDATYFSYTDGAGSNALHPANDSNWELVFSDEFDGSSLDLSKWNTTYYYGSRTNTWNDEEQYYVDDAFQFDSGVMSITAEKQDTPLEAFEQGDIWLLESLGKSTSFDYTSGMISGHDKYAFTNGYMEISAQAPAGQSLWSAFWMLPSSGEWPPELDIMEILGQQTESVITTMHYEDENDVHQFEHAAQSFSDVDFSSGFHTFAAEWNEDTITWLVDGAAIYSVENEIANQPMYLLANLAVGGSLPGATDITTPDLSQFDIDYIRVYQNDDSTLHGGDADDQLSRELGNLSGEAGNDTLTGGTSNNTLNGGSGNDVLDGASGDDVLMGTDAIALGLDELDVLTGGAGADTFVLGESNSIFYRDANVLSIGDQDYAQIQDFDITEDTIQLSGLATDYVLGTNNSGQSTSLWFMESSAQLELIATLEQIVVSDFSAGFTFV